MGILTVQCTGSGEDMLDSDTGHDKRVIIKDGPDDPLDEGRVVLGHGGEESVLHGRLAADEAPDLTCGCPEGWTCPAILTHIGFPPAIQSEKSGTVVQKK